MPITDRRGQPLPDNHPFKGGIVVLGKRKPAQVPQVHSFDPPRAPEWNGPAKVVFSISEESSDGGSSYCWIERRDDNFILFGNGLGQMSEPCSDPLSALSSCNAEFGMAYVTIKSSLSIADFRELCSQIHLSNVATLIVNGLEIKARDIDGVAAHYRPKRA